MLAELQHPADWSSFWASICILENSPAGTYWFNVNNGNTRTMCEIYSKLAIKTTEWCRRHSGFFVVNFEYISLTVLFLLLTMNKWMPTGIKSFFEPSHLKCKSRPLMWHYLFLKTSKFFSTHRYRSTTITNFRIYLNICNWELKCMHLFQSFNWSIY